MSHRDAEDFALGSGNVRRSDGSSTTAAAITTTTTPTTTAAPGTASAMTTAAAAATMTTTKNNKSTSDVLRLHHDDRLLLRPSLGSITTAPSGIGRQEGSRGRRGRTTDDPSGAVVAAATATIMKMTTTTVAANRTSALQEAVVTPHERLGGGHNDEDGGDHPSPHKKHKTSHDEEDDADHDPKRQALWGRLEDNVDESKVDGVEAASGTDNDINAGNVLHEMVNYQDEIKQLAKTFHRQYEVAAAERDYFRGLSNDSRSEIDRLKSNDEQNRKTIASLIRAKEVALAQAREATSVTSQEGALRAELSDLTQKYDTATTELAESKRTSELLRGELDHVRALLSKCKSDKGKLERSKRNAENAAAAAAAAAQAGGGGSGGGAGHCESDKSELDFYKAKTSDLNMKLNRLNAVVEEKDRQLVDAQRQLDRNVLLNPHHHPVKIMSSASSSAGGTGKFSAAASSAVNRGGSQTY